MQVICVVQRKEDVDQLLQAGSLNKPLGWGLVLVLAAATIARYVLHKTPCSECFYTRLQEEEKLIPCSRLVRSRKRAGAGPFPRS